MALLKRLRGNERAQAPSGRRAADEDAAAAARAPALHPRHRAGRARLFPDPAILAGRLRRTTSPTWSASWSTATPTARAASARARSRRRRRSTIRRSASTIRACAAASASGRAPAARPGSARHGRPAADALLRAGRQHRALRRRDRRPGGARPARDPGLRQRPRRAAGDRALLPRRTAGRRSTRWSRSPASRWSAAPPTTTPGRPRRCWPRSTCPTSRRTRSSSRRCEQWRRSDRGLMPVEATMMVAIPELDGATGPDGCSAAARRQARRRAVARHARAHRASGPTMLAARVGQAGRAAPRGARPSARSRSCCSTFRPMPAAPAPPPICRSSPRCIDTLPALSAGRLRGRGAGHGRRAARADHRRQRRALRRRRQRPRPHPGRRPCAPRALARARSRRNGVRRPADSRATAASIFVLGERFGNVFVGVQPAFGYEGDPMRLLFEKGFAPTHAFSAFYRWLREDFGAHAVLHFGTHGALEFMPGKQAGPVRRLLARPADRRSAELLSLRRQQPVRGHDRQAPRRRRR